MTAEVTGEARAALDWLLPDGGDLADLTQRGLQEFLWYQLPMKWLTDQRQHHEVAWALGDALEAAGLDRYAALCRSEATHQVIARWEPDADGARGQLRRLMEDSGVEPPDTQLLAWGDVQGMEEYAASWRVSRALESAIEDGRLVPGARGWKRVAEGVAEATLLGPAAPDDERPLVSVVIAERCADWLRTAGFRKLEVGEELQALVQDPASHEGPQRAEELAAVGATLEPLQWFLGQVGDGVMLTQAGYLPKALALAADERYDWFDLKPKFTVRGERDLLELTELRELARDQRLVTLRHRRLSLSAQGRRVLADPAALAEVALRHLCREGTWLGDTGLAVGAHLLQHGDGPVLRDDLDSAVAAYLGTHWRYGSTPVRVPDVASTTYQVLRLARVFGWAREPHPHAWREAPVLTPDGRRAFLAGIRAVARAPRRR